MNLIISSATCYSTCNLVSCLWAEADLRIGQLQWGDSGVYFCKVVVADDLEGRNEGQVELLVLGMVTFHLSQSSDIKTSQMFWGQFYLFMFVCLYLKAHCRLFLYDACKGFQKYPFCCLCIPKCSYSRFHGDDQMVFSSLHGPDPPWQTLLFSQPHTLESWRGRLRHLKSVRHYVRGVWLKSLYGIIFYVYEYVCVIMLYLFPEEC